MKEPLPNESVIFANALRLADAWRLQGQWQDAQTLLDGLHPVAERIDQNALATV